MSESEIEWPWQYNFPPFFTLQPHEETRAKQVAAWKSLILEYCKHHKITVIDVRETADIPLFNNSSINRTINADILLLVLRNLEKSGNAAPLDKPKVRWEIYWHTLEEFGTLIYNYVSNNNSLNTVLTLYELTESEEVANEEFYKLSSDIMVKALKLFEERGKCELIMFDDNQGVKFF